MSERAKPRSLVTGACGFMGSHMVEVLAEAGHEIRATDLPEAYRAEDPKRGRFPGVLNQLGVEFVPADLARPETLAPLVEDLDYVFHLAAAVDSRAPWARLKQVNVDGTRALLEQARAANPGLRRAVVWSAGGVYALPEPDELPLREDRSPVAPGTDYLRSKWRAEHAVMELGRERELKWTILRPTVVYGPRAVRGGGRLITNAARARIAAVPRNFTTRIPFVHVRDVCGAALYLADRPAAENQIFNVGDDSPLSHLELVRLVAELLGHRFVELPPLPVDGLRALTRGVADLVDTFAKVSRVPLPRARDAIAYLGHDVVFSNEKLKGTGYAFIYPDARDGIRDTVRWYQQKGWL